MKMLAGALGALLLIGCTGEQYVWPRCSFPAGDADYLVQYVERAGGTCGKIDAGLITFVNGQSKSVSGVVTQELSSDECTLSVSDNEGREMSIKWSETGERGRGEYTIPGNMPCSSVYDVIVTRQ